MSRPSDEVLLAFLEGRLDEAERKALLDRLDDDPDLAAELRRAAAGLAAFDVLGEAAARPEVDGGPAPVRHGVGVAGLRSGAASGARAGASGRAGSGGSRRISPWWAVAASAATLLLSVPVTWALAASGDGEPPVGTAEGPAPAVSAAIAAGMPDAPRPSFVVVLHGTWPDAGAIAPEERRRRANEYWSWTSSLARQGLLVAAGDLRWEPGERLGPAGMPSVVSGEVVSSPDYMVGMFAVRAESYEQALEIARACPHLLYGGSVSVRRVGSGFVTVPGMGDWSD